MRCKWTTLENHPVTVIELAGEIDSERELEPLEEIAQKEETEHVAVLLEHVTYINSRGVGVLVRLKDILGKRGSELYLVGPMAGVVDVIRCLGGDDVFNMRDSLQDVIREVEG